MNIKIGSILFGILQILFAAVIVQGLEMEKMDSTENLNGYDKICGDIKVKDWNREDWNREENQSPESIICNYLKSSEYPTFIINLNNLNIKNQSSVGSDKGYNSISSIYFGGNIVKLWNVTESGIIYKGLLQTIPDIDGDGLEDVVETINMIQYPYKPTVKVRKGTNGKLLWSKSFNPYTYAIMTFVPDINGDKLWDILLMEGDIGTYSKISAKKGINGQTLWSDSQYTQKGFVHIFGYFAGDINKDGLSDIMTYGYSFNGTSDKYYNIFKARKGLDGKVLWQKSASISRNTGNIAMIPYFIGDVNSDGYSDILLVTNKYYISTDTQYRTTSVFKGLDGKAIWYKEETLGPEWEYWDIEFVKDINGDSVKDILYTDYLKDTSSLDYISRLITRNGRYGNIIWGEQLHGSYGEYSISTGPIYDINGDHINDILFTYDRITTDARTVTLMAREGKSGKLLWWLYFPRWVYNRVYVSPSELSDVNKNGINDVMLEIVKEKTDSYYSISSGVKVIEGKTGANIWEYNTSSLLYTYTKSRRMGDANGDGIEDILINIQKRTGSNKYYYEYKVKKGNTGYTLWNESTTFYGADGYYSYLIAYPIGDLNGDKRNDIVKTTHVVDSYQNSYYLIALAGPSGTYLWKVKSTGQDNYINPIGEYFINLNGDMKNDVLFTAGKEVYAVTTK